MFTVSGKEILVNVKFNFTSSSIHNYMSEYNLPTRGNTLMISFSNCFLFVYNFVELAWFRFLQLVHLLNEHFFSSQVINLAKHIWSRLILHDGELYQYTISNKLHTHTCTLVTDKCIPQSQSRYQRNV